MMFAKINRAAFLGLLLAGLGTVTIGAHAAPTAKGCCDSKAAVCCQTKTRCCDKAGPCCDTPGAECCVQKINCCETSSVKATATKRAAKSQSRAQCCATNASTKPANVKR